MAMAMTLIRLLVGRASAINTAKPTSFLVIVAAGQYKIFACCVLDHHRDFNNSITLSPGELVKAVEDIIVRKQVVN